MIVLTRKNADNVAVETWTIEYKEDEEPVVEPVQQQMESVLEPGDTPSKRYRPVKLGVLIELGGLGFTEDVCVRVEEIMRPKLLQGDYELVWTGKNRNWSEPRWRNRVRWERKAMVKDGLLKKNSPNGIWELA